MNFEILSLVAVALAAIPCVLFVANSFIYRPPSRNTRLAPTQQDLFIQEPGPAQATSHGVSVLIPARNEEKNLPAALESVLASRDCELEVVVLDDHSTDDTAGIVRKVAERDSRVRLEKAPPLPAGWCGKQHACYVLAGLARHRHLVFLDADVRVAPDALKRMLAFMEERNVALASGVPRQQFGTVSERLLLPLIHFVLLGFLPMQAMRRTRWSALSAGCGQLFIARHDAYVSCGGHARLRHSMQDGIQLPRAFRRAGFRTDLFDATDLATCRMYRTNRKTLAGLAKNATEGLAAPPIIGPITALLLGGQVLPFAMLACAHWIPRGALNCAVLAAFMAYMPRMIAAWRFRQPLGSALLHPIGVLALVAIQWHALIRHVLGRPTEWKGRRYATAAQVSHAKAL